MKCFKGKLRGRTTLIAAKSKRRAATILGVTMKRLEEVPYPSWVKDEVVYVRNEIGDYVER